jgi:hypothetical protein
LALEVSDFFNSSGVPPAVKFGSQPHADQITNGAITNQITWKAEHIDVVMPSAGFRHDFIGAGRSSHMGEFVGGDRHADSGAADQYASFDLSFRHASGDFCGEVRVVDSLIAMRSAIYHFVAVGGEVLHQFVFDLGTAVVATNCDAHGLWILIENVGSLVEFSSVIRGIERWGAESTELFDPESQIVLHLASALLVGGQRAAERIGYFPLSVGQKVDFVGQMGPSVEQRVAVAFGHHQDQVR